MASTQVITFSGSSYTYTNTTGKNARFIISYCDTTLNTSTPFTISCDSINLAGFFKQADAFNRIEADRFIFGKNVSAYSISGSANSAIAKDLTDAPASGAAYAAPSEIYVANGKTLTITSPGFVLNAMVVTES